MQIIKQFNLPGDDKSPRLLHISYAEPDGNAQFRVSQMLWVAWTSLQPQSNAPSFLLLGPTGLSPAGNVGSFVKNGISMTNEQVDAIPQDPNKTSLHTEWRDQVYMFWNHAFYDVGSWLGRQFETESGVSHFQPPSSEAFGLPFAGPDDSMTKVWDRDVFLVPAYLHTGVSIRLSVVTKDISLDVPGPPVEEFDVWGKGDMYYVRRGTKVRLIVEGRSEDVNDNLAAVIVSGIFCAADDNDPDDPPGRPEQQVLTESEVEEEDLQNEVQSSLMNAFALAGSVRGRGAMSDS